MSGHAERIEPEGAPAGRHRQMGGLGLAMVLLLGMQTVVLLVAAGMEFALAAQPSPAPSEFEDSLDTIDGLFGAQLLLFVALAVMFIVWAWCGVKNLEAMGQQPRRSSGWAVGGWFIPVANWWIPYQTIHDIWAQLPERYRPAKSLGRVWLGAWVLWLVTGAASRVVWGGDQESLEELQQMLRLAGVVDIGAGVSVVLAAVAVWSISAAQDRASAGAREGAAL